MFGSPGQRHRDLAVVGVQLRCIVVSQEPDHTIVSTVVDFVDIISPGASSDHLWLQLALHYALPRPFIRHDPSEPRPQISARIDPALVQLCCI